MRRRRYSIAFAGTAAIWLVIVIATPHPENPTIDPVARLEAGGQVPASTLTLLKTACFDCHSDETVWPWYTRLFPASWLVRRDVEAGRGQMNFSKWTEYNVFDRADKLDAACDEVRSHAMPLWQYRLLHRDARLSEAQIDIICVWTHAEAERLVNEAEP